MDAQAARTAVLISVHPEFADGILDGSKTVEFRRVGVPASVETVVLYSTSPIQKVVGFFDVLEVDSASPTELWRRYSDGAGIDRTRFRAYFKGRRRGHAIRVRESYALCHPVGLTDLLAGAHPPQSFQYLDSEIVGRLRNLVRRSAGVEGPHRIAG